MENETPWHWSEHTLAQARRFNKTLAWLPRFRIRNRFTPLAIQALLRMGQLRSATKLARHGLHAQRQVLSCEGHQVPVRILRPNGPARALVIDIHGGGWVIGNAQMNDDLNVAMVNACQVTVVSVDYRLATSTPIEGLLADCLAAARSLLSQEHPEFVGLPVILVGESAGGHLAAATLLALKQWPSLLQRVSGAVLYYGVYDFMGTPSVRAAKPDTLVLDGPGMVAAFRRLTPGLTDAQRAQAPLSPLYGDFNGLPPALLLAGELDPLRDDTLMLAEQWGASAPVESHLVPCAPHGFIHFPTAMANEVVARTHAWINQRIAASLP
ncbi:MULTISPECIES: alpha/beta fold hydrolase [Pseudomonas]|uniref:alpha/beta fold hydrolase n=1 Tax=Pseudomonas TaxID=286 RepID=UPI002D21C8D8|nr:alpha/beta fold hydrolase [Pseudomonas sp. LY10J]